MSRLALVPALLVAAACTRTPPPAEPAPLPGEPATEAAPPAAEVPADLVTAVERVIAMVEALANAAAGAGAGGDCDEMASEMRLVATGPEGNALLELGANPAYEAHAAAIDARFGERLDRSGERLFGGLGGCFGHPAVEEVLSLVGLGDDPEAGGEAASPDAAPAPAAP